MTDNHQPPAVPAPHINFEAPAVLRKWPSLNNQRRTEGPGPYLLIDGTLDECIREFMAKPAPMRHLYEIHTSPQPPWNCGSSPDLFRSCDASLGGALLLKLAETRHLATGWFAGRSGNGSARA